MHIVTSHDLRECHKHYGKSINPVEEKEVDIDNVTYCHPNGPLYIKDKDGMMITISRLEYNRIIGAVGGLNT